MIHFVSSRVARDTVWELEGITTHVIQSGNWRFLIFLKFIYREAETVDPRSGQAVHKGIARRALPASGSKDAVGGNKKVNKGE